MSQPVKPTVETTAAIGFGDVYDYINGDYYVSRRASYDIPAIVAQLAQEHPGAELADIDSDTVWVILEAHVSCLHSAVAGMMAVSEEDFIAVAEGSEQVKCEHCERVFAPQARLWVKL